MALKHIPVTAPDVPHDTAPPPVVMLSGPEGLAVSWSTDTTSDPSKAPVWTMHISLLPGWVLSHG